MCTIKKMTVGDRTIRVADIKMKYMEKLKEFYSEYLHPQPLESAVSSIP